MIFMKSFSRSSLATGPNIRVPLGLLSVLITTAAFSSKRIYDPSARRNPFFERTITALTTSPFLTTPPGVASLTVAVITSPILPYLPPNQSKLIELFLLQSRLSSASVWTGDVFLQCVRYRQRGIRCFHHVP